MKAVFVAMFVANIVLLLASLAVLPEQVASHFGIGGEADSWMSKGAYVAFMLAMQTFLFVLLLCVVPITTHVPRWMINLPHKEYWLRPENGDELRRKLDGQMTSIGVALFALMFCVQLMVIHANLSQPVRLHEPVFLVLLGTFFVFIIFWIIRYYRAFRVPKQTE